MIHNKCGFVPVQKYIFLINALYKVSRKRYLEVLYSVQTTNTKINDKREKKNLLRWVMEFSNDIVLPNEPNRNIIIKIAIRLPTGYST